MSHFLVEFAGTHAAFPGGEPTNPVAIAFGGKLHAPTGSVIPTTEGQGVVEFCEMLGIKLKISKPILAQKTFLTDWVRKNYPETAPTVMPAEPRKAKQKVEAKTKAPPKGPTPEQQEENAVIEALKAAHPFREESRGGHGRGGQGQGRGGRGRGPKTLIFQVEDKHGRMAEAQYAGKGQFKPFQPREGGGTKTMARNKWACRVFFEHYGEALGNLEG